MRRRDLLAGLATLAAFPLPGHAEEPGLRLGAAEPFDPAFVRNLAERLSRRRYAARPQIPQAWRDLSYDEYRQIWFDARNALWNGTDTPQRVDVFPPGLFFPRGVRIDVVEDGLQRPLHFDLGVFDRTDGFPDLPVDDTLGYSGLRLRGALREPGIFEEYAVFQGASYFRGIGTGQVYGLSARGLALGTAQPEGEEFPDFVRFWIERPETAASEVVVHALLDSPSCTGAYRFVIRPGSALSMQVSATLFARTRLTHLGIAPLTSMFLYDETARGQFDDFRPAVHDSDGLLINNGAGEAIWRPLSNPNTLQVSAFVDDGPRGFGLLQRARSFSDFADLEALYHRRPGLWVTPKGDWGNGAVTLVEIPADREIYDNIVAFWRPEEPLAAGSSHDLHYDLTWGADPAPDAKVVPVLNTAAGGRAEGGRLYVIDFAPSAAVPEDLGRLEKIVRASAGEVSEGVVQRNPETGGPRLAFTHYPRTATLAEFRAQLQMEGRPLTEVWLYRWTA